MQKQIFSLQPTDEFIDLISLLKRQGIAQTGGHAKMIVNEGGVKVNGEKELRKRKKLRVGDVVEMEGFRIEIALSV